MEDLKCPQAGGLRDILIPPYLLLQHFPVATPIWRCQRVNTISSPLHSINTMSFLLMPQFDAANVAVRICRHPLNPGGCSPKYLIMNTFSVGASWPFNATTNISCSSLPSSNFDCKWHVIQQLWNQPPSPSWKI
jgi:hypothetical protein